MTSETVFEPEMLDPIQTLNIDENNEIINNTRETEETEFYEKAQKYWSKIPPTVDGMLGGFGKIHNLDIFGSQKFLVKLFADYKHNNKQTALDCGAGIGRVSKYLLIPIFQKVDLVEQDPNFCKTALEYIEDTNEKLGKIHNCGLQNFLPEPAKYDIIWCQWVLGHLQDNDLLSFLTRIRVGLRKGGLVILKENVTSSDKIELDVEDSSMTRPFKSYSKILKKAKYKILNVTKQVNFPRGLYPVYMIAAEPI